MKKEKRKNLEASGWKVGNAEDFLNLTAAEAALIEMKLASGLTAPDRPRDFDDVIRLIRANALGEGYAEQLHPYVREKYCELWGYAQRPSEPGG